MNPIDRDKMFNDYLTQNVIFIVDFNASSRSRLMRSLIDLGAKSTNIQTFKQFDQAVAEMEKARPMMIFTDYKLGKQSAFDLLQAYKPIHDEEKKSLFVLITSNSSQSLVAQAAEEDIDAFILKPFTLETFKKVFIDAVISKIDPSEYLQKIEEGKLVLFSGKPKESLPLFEAAMTMHPKPALACFYHGQAEKMLELMTEAEGQYKKGLEFNTIHYKCLSALFDVLLDEKRYDEAYNVVKLIIQYFPANPKRLTTVIRLSIQTNHFEDIENLYQIFMDMETRSDEVVSYICAGLVVCGKYYLMNNQNEKALNIYSGLKNSLSGKNEYLLYIIENLVIYNLGSEAGPFLKRFPPDSYETDAYYISEYLAQEHQLSDEDSIKKGAALLAKNKYNHCIYYAIIRRLYNSNKPKEAEEYKLEAIKKFPFKKRQFDALRG